MKINHKNIAIAKAATLDFNNTQIQTIRNYKWQIGNILGLVNSLADTEDVKPADVKAMSMVFDVLANDSACQNKAYIATQKAAVLTAEEFRQHHIWCVGQTAITSSRLGQALQESMQEFNVTPEAIATTLGITK
jgi:hypothetical protein